MCDRRLALEALEFSSFRGLLISPLTSKLVGWVERKRYPSCARAMGFAKALNPSYELFLYRRFHEPGRIGAEFAHDLVVIRLFHGDWLQAIFR